MTPSSPAPMIADAARYGFASAPDTRHSRRCDFGEPGISRIAVVRFSTPHVNAVGAHAPFTSRV